MRKTVEEPGLARAHRSAGLLSGALLVFVAFSIYTWIGTNGFSIDSFGQLAIPVAVMALPTAFVVFAAVRLLGVLKEEQVPAGGVRYSRIFKPASKVVWWVSLVVGIVAAFAFDSLGRVDALSKIMLFLLGALGAAVLGMAVVALTALLAYGLASNAVRRRHAGGA